MELDRETLNARPGTIEGAEPVDERKHFFICPKCGQAVDVRRLGDVLHHRETGHKPLPQN
jgi:hypothetical protein